MQKWVDKDPEKHRYVVMANEDGVATKYEFGSPELRERIEAFFNSSNVKD